MPTCLLKRVLPFALTLVVGLVLGHFLGKARQPVRNVWVTHQGISAGAGPGLGKSPTSDSIPVSVYSPRDVDRKAKVLSRPEPKYTEEARDNFVEGTVVLRAVFSEDGLVRNVRVVSGLPDGLTEKAVEAAQEIKFSPALIDGRAVSQYIQIEYDFHLY